MLAVLAWLGFAMLLAYALLVGGGWPGIHLVQLRVADLAIAAAVLAGWFILTLRRPEWRPRSVIWPTLLIPLVVLGLATLASPFPRLGLEYVAWAVLLVGLYLLLVRILATETARERIGGLAALLAIVVGTAYVASVLLRWLEWWDLVGAPAMPPLRPLYAGLTLGGPNGVLVAQVLLASVAVGGLGTGSRGRRMTLGAVLALTAIVVVLTGSRAGWLAIVTAFVVVGGAWIVARVRQRRGDPRGDRHKRPIALAVAAALVTAVLVLIAAPLVAGRFLGAGDGGRSDYFDTAIRMFADHPILGMGPGAWAVHRAAYTQAGEMDWYVPHAHDIYLQAGAELGSLGVLAGIIALIPVVLLVIAGLRDASGRTRRWAWVAAFVLVYLAAHHVLDFYANMPGVMALAAIPVAMLDAEWSTRGRGLLPTIRLDDRSRQRLSAVARAALWVACLVAALVLARTESIALTHQAAVADAYADDWEAARTKADATAVDDPDMPAYQQTLGLIASQQEDWLTATIAYLRAATADDMPQSWLGLAQAAHALGRSDDEVRGAIERALRLGQQQPAVVYAAGALFDRLGDIDAADKAYAAAIAALPSLAGDPSWTSDPALADRWDTIRALAMSVAPETAWAIALAAGDGDDAESLADDGPRPDLAHLVVDAWTGDSAATTALYELASAQPDDAEVLSWAARIAHRAGDASRSDRFQRLAIYAVAEGGQLPGTEIGVDRDGWFDHVPAGTITGYAGHYLYRRPLPPDLIPPGLPRLVNVQP